MRLVGLVLAAVFAVHRASRPPPLTSSMAARGGEARIVGGQDARISEHPYQAAWLYKGRLHCGACIISAEWLLSAAHCFPNKNDTGGNVFRVGSPLALSGGRVHEPAAFYQHPVWEEVTKAWDIGLIRLRVALRMNRDVRPIRLAGPRTRLNESAKLSVSGWGLTEFGGDSHEYGGSLLLQRVEISFVDHERCNKTFDETFKLPVTDGMLCAQGNMKGACMGDSGGPLVMAGEGDLPLRLVGVVSWGAGCSNDKYPNVFTDLRHPPHRRYIETVSGLSLDAPAPYTKY